MGHSWFFNKYHIEKSDLLITGVRSEPEVVQESYADGVEFALGDDNPVYGFEDKTALRLDVVPGGQFPMVVSSRFRDELESFGVGHIEFHPVELVCEEDGSVVDGYFLLNLLDNVACLNRERSNFDLFHPDHDIIVSVSKLVIDASKAAGRDLFRIAEYPTVVIYSAPLAEYLRGRDLRGLNLRPIDEYRPI